MLRFISIISILFSCIVSFAQKTVKVDGTYIYRCTGEVSVEQAKRTALERAQLEAIANTFGTKVTQYNSTRVSNNSGESNIDFLSLSSSDVQGEWIETIGEPKYEINFEQGMLIVECSVKGVIREITSAAIDIKAKVLRNGTDDKFESTEFRDGDDLYLYFQSPVDGYLAVYLIDSDNNAFCLLPYQNQGNGIYKVEGNKQYIFFSEKDASIEERPLVNEYTLTSNSHEVNSIFLIFSPYGFTKATDNLYNDSLPRELDLKSFMSWLSKVRRKDKALLVKNYQITIDKPQ